MVQSFTKQYKVRQILNSSLVFSPECIAFNQSALHHFLQESELYAIFWQLDKINFLQQGERSYQT